MLIQILILRFKKIITLLSAGCLACVFSVYAHAQTNLTLQQSITRALLDDDWLVANLHRENVLIQQSILSGQLPDPKMSVGLANLPINTFDFNQEAMTQFKIGVKQTFPRGDSRALGQQQKIEQSEINPFLRDERKASVTLQLTKVWLDSYLAQETIALINNDRALFEQLIDITDTRYRTGSGSSRQQDVIRAELELTRLDYRLASQNQKLSAQKQQLAQWLPNEWLELPINTELPEIALSLVELNSLAQASQTFENHPSIRALGKQVDAAMTGVELAKQSYKSAFTVGANYGYRDNGPMGMQRDDFISLEVSFDLPFFTKKRQKPKVEAASYSVAAVQTERTLLLRNLFASYQRAAVELTVLEERKSLFEDVLLIQMSELTEATLVAYTADEGNFEEVTRAYIAELNAKIELLGIEVEYQKIRATLNYLLTESESN